MRLFGLLCALFYFSAVGVALPFTLYSSEDEEYRLELKGYIKSFSLLFFGMERFIPEEAPKDLEKLSLLFRTLKIPLGSGSLEEQWADFRREFSPLALQQLWFRLGFRAKLGESASISIAYELRPELGSEPQALISKIPILGGAMGPLGSPGSGGEFPLSPFTTFDDRWLDFPPTAYKNHSFRLRHYLERLYFSYSFSFGELTVGRQPLSLSMGRIFRPADLLAPFSPQEFDTEEKRGVDAVKFDFEISDLSELSIIGAVQRYEPWKERKVGDKDYFSGLSPAGLARFKWNLWEWDFFVLAGYSFGDFVGAIGSSGAIWKIGFQAELTYRYPLLEPEPRHPGGLWSLAVNLEYKFSKPEILIELSYFHQSVGESKPYKYLDLLKDKRYRRGEAFLLGTDYLALFFSWQIHPLFSFQSFVIANLLDPSALMGPSFEISLAQDLILSAAVYLGVGLSPQVRWAVIDKERSSSISLSTTPLSEFGLIGAIGILALKYYY